MNANAEPCPLCRGLKTMTFALASPISASFAPGDIPPVATIRQKTYPCPECSTPQNKVAIARGVVEYDGRPRYMLGSEIDWVNCQKAAQELFAFIMRAGLIRYDVTLERAVATLGVVADDHANLIEQFTRERVREAVAAVRDAAIEGVRVWGSNQEGRSGRIDKPRAVDIIAEEARKVLS